MGPPGYERSADPLLRHEPFVVYRGRRTRDGRAVLLETVAAPAPADAADALEREADLLRELALPGLPVVLDVVRHGGAPWLIVEDAGLAPLSARLASRPPDVGAAIEIALALTTLLDELHGRRLAHVAIAPDAVLASPDGREIALFGLAWAERGSGGGTAAAPVTPYTAPERTGRMHRAADHRADLYALGATLYALLAGHPPFSSDDVLELIHGHLARTPEPPAGVPAPLAALVLRLLAKAPEDRYPHAPGVRHDLEICRQAWAADRTIPEFELGRARASGDLEIPQRLYGRERETAALLRAFEAASEGRASLLLVSGYSGIGKTSLIGELSRPIVRRGGHFVRGKFDPVVRSIPYGAVIQAVRGLVWQLLTEPEDQVAAWRARVADAVGVNGGVLTEVIPEIEFLVGAQPPPPPLAPAEAQNRFRFVFQSFVGALARAEHPLALFLDDLQWVDAATLDLLHALVTDPGIRHLLVIGAYRDNEVDAGHRLSWAIDRLTASGAPVHRLSLGPLAPDDVTAFVGTALGAEPADVEPLARLVLEKTDGNPFFVIQFLKDLQQEGLIRFDRARARWTWDLGALARAGLTDNVVDLMTRRIRRLPRRAQDVLTLAACIGSPFAWHTFLTVSRLPQDEAAGGLADALEAGLIHPVAAPGAVPDARAPAASVYAFLHDRVQQAAYGLIPDEQQRPVHLDVGRLLLAECGEPVPDDRLFPIVNHLNVGRALISERAERRLVARLNLAAGRKAKASAAFHAAAGYLEEGIALAGPDGWTSDAELLFALHLEAAECHYLAGRFDQAESYFELLLARAATPLDRAQVHGLRIILYENLSRYAEAVASGREGLALFGLSFPQRSEDAEAALEDEIARIQALVGDRPIAALADLPVADSPDVRMVLRLLTSMWAPTYLLGDALLARLISATMVRLSLERGHTEDSAYGYVTHAITIGPVRRDYGAAFDWGELALAVNERFGDLRRRAKIQQQFHAHVKLWRRPFETCLPHAREARRLGLETGDFTYAGYGAVSETWVALPVSRTLDRFLREYSPSLGLLEKIRMDDFRAALTVMLQWAEALRGRTDGPLTLTGGGFDEGAFRQKYASAPFFLMMLHAARLHLAVVLHDRGAAVEAAREARAAMVGGTIWPVLIEAYGALAMAAAFADASPSDRDGWSRRLADAEAYLDELAASCPENFRVLAQLVSAERRRVTTGAIDLDQYDAACAYAREIDNVQLEALASELGGRACLLLGDETGAASRLRDARAAWAVWGAAAKVRQLDLEYAAQLSAAAFPADAARAAVSLDLATVLKVARAVAGEIEREALLRRLLALALENAGAERGVFLQEREGRLFVEAEAAADAAGTQLVPSVPFEESDRVAPSVVRYVRRTGRDVVVDNAADDERFGRDAYVGREGVRSVLCVPVVHQGRLGGVLYLEHRMAAGVFTPARAELMHVLAAQAGISLENARLYDGLKHEVARRTEAEAALREALTEVEGLKNRLEAENVYLQEEIRTQHNFNEIVGNSPALLEVLHRVERVAPTESSVLIAGETGSGKELFARAVHSRSRRRARPLVKVNCGAIAPGLVESELFGHVKGAFTGAIDKRVGRFELADGGTIFLDEVGELPLEAQVKLLRVLQEQEFEPVGSSRTVRVDVRVIAATNRNLEQAVREGRFRADLLYRLNVFPVTVPPLRQRASDIPLLVSFFVSQLERRLGKPIQGVSSRSLDRMLRYAWPGNVRELQNVVERAAILAQGPFLEPEVGAGDAAEIAPPAAISAGTLEELQRERILAALRQTRGVVEGARGAATILGLHPNTLRSRMKKLGIQRLTTGD